MLLVRGATKALFQRILYMVTLILLGFFVFGAMSIIPPKLLAASSWISLLTGFSIVAVMRKEIATFDIGQLFHLSFSLFFIDYLLYYGSLAFKKSVLQKLGFIK